MKYKIILSFVILIAFVLRFWQLGINPPSLTWDEVAWGYNAYALGIDGKDEFGKFLPVSYLESFGDFKPPLYAYLDIIPVKIFGLTEFATRFPAAFFGVLTVFLSYFLVQSILFNSKNKKEIALLTSFILAISPWHIMLSRAAFEANVATFFIVLGVFLFFRGILKNPILIVFSVCSFVLSAYTFNTARIVAPLLLIALAVSSYKFLILQKKVLFISILVGFVLCIPLLQFLITPQAKLRFQEVNIFTDSSIVERANQQIQNDNNAWWSKVIHNRRLGYSAEYIKHYLDNLSPAFLFVKGDGNPKFSTQDVGQLYLWEFPFFILGMLLLFKKREGFWWIIPYWLLIAILPAGAARETPHSLRIESSLPTFQFLTAYGLYYAVTLVRRTFLGVSLRKVFIGSMTLVIIGSFAYFIYNYFVHYPREFSGEWQYGYKDAILYTESVKDSYDAIYFTQSLGRPYVYVLFYGNYNPEVLRSKAKIEREVFGFVHVNELGKYKFVDVVASSAGELKSLYVDNGSQVPVGSHILKEIKLLNGNPGLTIYER